MKNILLIIALFAFLNSYATDPLSWGKKGGSGGVTQSQLDAKVDTSLIITGQEALDSLEANISRTAYGYPNILILAAALDTPIIATNIYIDFSASVSVQLNGNSHKLNTIYVKNDTTVNGVKIDITTASSSVVYGLENSLQLYKYNGGTATKVATTANDGTVYDSPEGWICIPFTSPVRISKGYYGIGILTYMTSGTPASILTAGINPYDYYGIGYYPNYYYYASGVASSTLDLSTPAGISANTILVQLY